MTCTAYGEFEASGTSPYIPSAKERQIFHQLFFGSRLSWSWHEQIFQAEPVAIQISVEPERIDWNDSIALGAIFDEIGEEQAAFANMGMTEYSAGLKLIDEVR